MSSSILHIKNMVCNRCIKVVNDELSRLNILVTTTELGKVCVSPALSDEQLDEVKQMLENNGFELIDNKKNQLIDRIKTLIIERIHHADTPEENINTSDYLARELGHDYSYLSNLFSSTEGITIEKYIINQKVEKVKELLTYDELSLSEIAYRLAYSSVQHLSNQFKKVTQLTPTQFKKLTKKERKPLDEV